jgi:hypothetical protein
VDLEGGDMTPEDFGLARARQLEEAILEMGPDKVAAFIAEPVQGAGGVIVAPDTYWPEVQRIVDRYGILLIADEVICGFGRTGELVRLPDAGHPPDIMTVAKGLSSGTSPSAAVHRLRQGGGGDRQRGVQPRLHLFRPPGGLRRGAGEPAHLDWRRNRSSSACATETAPLPRSRNSRA